jgi:cell wall-associated NlpC family hydrolase
MNSKCLAIPHVPRRVVGFLVAAATALAAVSLLAAPSAGAATARPHDPIGAVTSVKNVTGGLLATGWAVDPDALTTAATVAAVLDGRYRVASGPTSIANPTVQAKYHTGATPGFSMTIPVPTGSHTVCIVARNAGAGLEVALKCLATPLGTTLSSSQLAAHNPVGGYSRLSAGPSSLRARGWTSDPDWVPHRMIVVLYVDNRSAATVTTVAYPAPRPAAAGAASAFDITVPVSRGAHLGCIWVVNVGLGHNAFLGCKSGDTRGPAGTSAVTTPALNTKVVTEAKRHIGQPYVWGATGPKSFDCSGLVMYSYGKFGYTTPRVSEDQFTRARLIPASRAVPGDLVFTHDSEGDVYHVGIYLSPGKTVAAIDENSGVNYQTIWDPSSTTYGSFTHS